MSHDMEGRSCSAEGFRVDLCEITATAPVKKQLIFREGGLDFLFLKRTFF